MPQDRNQSPGAPKRVFPMQRIKRTITSVGTAFIVPLSCLAGITPQAGLGTMMSWMHGFAPDKGQGTAMPATLAACFAFGAGAAARVLTLHTGKIGYHPSDFALALGVFVAVTLGALFVLKVAASLQHRLPRRPVLFIGVILGVFAASAATHSADVSGSVKIYELHGPLQILLAAVAAGALTQITGLASGTLLVPALFFLTRLSAVESVLISTLVVGLASILPNMGYARKGLTEVEYARPAAWTAVIVGVPTGYYAGGFNDRLVLLTYAVMAMFFAAREIAKVAVQAAPTGPDLR